MAAILIEEEHWASTCLSIVRHTGSIRINGDEFVIVNKEGKDIYQCSIEAEKAGRDKAIEPGEPADLVNRKYTPIYLKMGREAFIKMLKEHGDITPELANELSEAYNNKKE